MAEERQIDHQNIDKALLGDSDLTKLKGIGVRSLGDNPSADGISAETIKRALYRQSELLFAWLKKLGDANKGVYSQIDDIFKEYDEKGATNIELTEANGKYTFVLKSIDGTTLATRAIEFDDNPTQNSGKLVKSKGVYAMGKQLDDKITQDRARLTTNETEIAGIKRDYETKADASTKKQEAISSANAYADTNKLPKSEPVLTQMSQSDNAVTSKSFVAQSIAQAIAEADDSHITGISFSETSRGVWVLTVNRKDLDPLTAQFDIPESMILDTTNPPRLEGTNLILTFQGGSTVSVDMTGLVDVYTGFEGSTITTTVENNVIKATLKQTWVDFLNTAESSEATRVSNENTRISNESARQSAESSRASAEATRQSAFESKLNEWEGEFDEQLSEQRGEFSELVESAKIDDRKNDGKYRWNIRVSSEGKPQLVYYID